MSTHPLESFFWPGSIGILGASPDTKRIRGLLLSHLRHTGWEGRIVPINPSYDEIDGLRCYPSIEAAGGALDMVVIAIPAAAVLPASAANAQTYRHSYHGRTYRHYRCRRSSGTTGLVAGAVGGGVLRRVEIAGSS